MKSIKRILMGAALTVATALTASAQYYQIADQTMNMIQQIFSGGANYRGTLDAAYTFGVGSHKANVLEFTTTQGVMARSWMFMGVGAGVDILSTDNGNTTAADLKADKKLTTTGYLVPLYSDFRFLIGKQDATRAFIDLRIGGAFLVGKNYVQIDDGYLTRSECFYLKPSVGARIPLSQSNPKLAMNVGVSYMLLTNGYWYGNNSTIALSSIGATVQFEW